MRNWYLILTLIILAGCSQAGNVSPMTVTPNPTNTQSLPMGTSTPIAALSKSSPGTEWKTFNSTNWQVALDYPPDWSVSERASGVSFTSQTDVVIQLTKIETGGLSPEEFLKENQLPNTRCTTSVNSYGIDVLDCLDTISGSYSADFVIKPPQGTPQLLSLAMLGKGDLQVFDKMVDSIRLKTSP